MKWKECMEEGNIEWALLLPTRPALVWIREIESHWEILAQFTEDQNWEYMDGCNSLEEAQQVALIRYRMEK